MFKTLVRHETVISIVFFKIKSLHCQYSHPSLAMWLISLRIPACPSINFFAIRVYDQHFSINLTLHSHCFPGYMHSSMEVINGPWVLCKNGWDLWVYWGLSDECSGSVLWLRFCESSLQVIGINDYNQYYFCTGPIFWLNDLFFKYGQITEKYFLKIFTRKTCHFKW